MCILAGSQLSAQNSIQELLTAGVEDTERFMTSYFKPGARGALYAVNAGWYNSAKAKKFLGFEISVIGNAAFVDDDKKSFLLKTSDYNNIRFSSGQNEMQVATVFGINEPEINVLIDYTTPDGSVGTAKIMLPQGAVNQSLNAVPAAFVQGSIGLFKGFEFKARFAPEIEYDDVTTNLYGAGIQYEFTSLAPADKVLPVAISGLIGYTHFDAKYDLDQMLVQGNGANVNTSLNTLNFSGIVSTNLPVINFYGGLNYMTGNAKSNLDGTFILLEGELEGQTVKNPIGIENSIDGFSATLGFNLKVGFAGLSASYSFQEFDAVSVGLNFGI